MARLLHQPLQGLAKQLLSAGTATSLQQDAIHLGAIAATATWQPFQQAWLHSPAGSRVASTAHSYHGSRDDDSSNNNSSNSNKAAAKPAKAQQEQQGDVAASTSDKSSETEESSPGHATQQLKALQDAIEAATEAVQAGQRAREAAQLPEYVARHAMRDPLGMLMTSQGVPLGISLKVNPESLLRQRRERDREAEADKRDWQDMIRQTSSSNKSSSTADSEDQHTAVPSTDAQLLRVKLIKEMKKLVTASKAAKDSTSSTSSSSNTTGELDSSSSSIGEASTAQNQQEQQQQQQEGVLEAATHQSPGYHHEASVGQQVKQQLEQLFASADSDSWGTTQQSPAEIAQQIADSNRRAAGGGGGGDESDGEGEGGEDDEPLSLSALEERYADQAAVTAELKEMDEIYEVLAKVPWLNDEEVDERELRGVVAVGLLGTLEEVGWQLREKLLTLWAGERDLDVLTAGVGPKEAAALTAILYHTEQLEREFDKPPAAGVAAALAAAGGAPQAAAGQTEVEARAALEAAENSTGSKN